MNLETILVLNNLGAFVCTDASLKFTGGLQLTLYKKSVHYIINRKPTIPLKSPRYDMVNHVCHILLATNSRRI
jgi:hypothetical protein